MVGTSTVYQRVMSDGRVIMCERRVKYFEDENERLARKREIDRNSQRRKRKKESLTLEMAMPNTAMDDILDSIDEYRRNVSEFNY